MLYEEPLKQGGGGHDDVNDDFAAMKIHAHLDERWSDASQAI